MYKPTALSGLTFLMRTRKADSTNWVDIRIGLRFYFATAI